MMKRIAIGLVLVAAAGPLVAQQPPAQQPPAQQPPAATASGPTKLATKPERRICKQSAPSGSLIETRRECHTRTEWNQIAQAARAQGQDMVDRAASGGQH